MKEDANIILVVDDERDHADGIAESLERFFARAIAVYPGKGTSFTITLPLHDL